MPERRPDMIGELLPVAPRPPRKPPRNPPPVAAGEWPTEDDIDMLYEMWTRQAYAGYTQCNKCPTMDYCYGPSYDKKTCFMCFIIKHKPKRKYKKRKK